jgi:uncharacterized protein (DUF1800 family)
MRFDPLIAETRFGSGLSPSLAPPGSTAEMLTRLTGPDEAAARFPIAPFQPKMARIRAFSAARRRRRRASTESAREAANDMVRTLRQGFRAEWAEEFGHTLLRRALSPDGFRERLCGFWSDHFTAEGINVLTRLSHASYVEEAIRPHVAGHFADMLRAVATHPYMLWYLDQANSMGDNSLAAQKGRRKGGLNENFARELLELHTLGVGAGYTQADVRELAELLAGLSLSMKEGEEGFVFKESFTEPGAETVLSQRYGGPGKGQLAEIHAVLDDLARHPATARHIARKLAVHFVSDTPDPALVTALEAAFRDSDGHLPTLYAALLDHPAAWDPARRNVKRPVDFIASSLRALDIHPKHVPTGNARLIRRQLADPMALMGQPQGRPGGPDGFPEADIDWITPQRLAARLQWAMVMPFQLMRLLPDPRAFVEAALGPDAPEPVRFAARAAETRAEGVGLVLASPAFQRM